MQQHPTSGRSLRRQKAAPVETFASLSGPLIDGFFETQQRPVGRHRNGLERYALKPFLIKSRKPLGRRRIRREGELPCPVQRCDLRSLRRRAHQRGRHQEIAYQAFFYRIQNGLIVTSSMEQKRSPCAS